MKNTEKSLQEIQATYDKQLENLENYVDLFARIDLSEISSQEQEIIELVQQGRFDEAIAKYAELTLHFPLFSQDKGFHPKIPTNFASGNISKDI